MVTGPTVVFRTDASLDIGTGHVVRCLTLARALREAGAACRFVTRALPGHLGDRIADEGFDITLLPAPAGSSPSGPPAHAPWAGVDWAQDAGETYAALAEAPPDWLVVDHYAFDARWQAAVRPRGTRVMVIDDLADRLHDCELLLDQNLGSESRDYDRLVLEGCTRLVGPHYALLRPEFAARRAAALARRLESQGLRHLLVTMGGVDRVDATSTILRALCEAPLPDEMRITVVMGGQAPALERVRALAAGMPWPTEVAVDEPDMAKRMTEADLAIGAGGATTWERCCLGLPSITVQIADNQAGIAQALAIAGAAINPGLLQAPGFARALATALGQASDPTSLATMSQTAASICDGDGVSRVTMKLLAMHSTYNTATKLRK